MSTQRPHKSWCSQSNVTMCNCRFPSGDDYIPGHHGPAPEPGACVFCGKRCYSRSPCAKRKEAAAVAAPLEPTPQDFYENVFDESLFDEPELADCEDAKVDAIRRFSFKLAEAYAAAVSKNLTDKYGEMEAKWMRELLTVSNEIGELKEHCISEHDCTFCGLESGKSPR